MERLVRWAIHWWLVAVCCVTVSGIALSLTFSAIHALVRHMH